VIFNLTQALNFVKKKIAKKNGSTKDRRLPDKILDAGPTML